MTKRKKKKRPKYVALRATRGRIKENIRNLESAIIGNEHNARHYPKNVDMYNRIINKDLRSLAIEKKRLYRIEGRLTK